MKVKPLLPTLRERKRYVAFEIVAQKSVDWAGAKDTIHNALQQHLGRVGMAQAGILFVKSKKNKGVLRVAHNAVKKVRAALLFVTHIQKQPVSIRSLGASGMLNKATAYMG